VKLEEYRLPTSDVETDLETWRLQLTVSDEARQGIGRICAARGPQVVLASWPGGAAYLPEDLYSASPFDVVIGRVGGCPIYADRRQLEYYADREVILDIAYTGVDRSRAVLLLRERKPAAGPIAHGLFPSLGEDISLASTTNATAS